MNSRRKWRLRYFIYSFALLVVMFAIGETAMRLIGFEKSQAYLFLIHSHARDMPLLVPKKSDPGKLALNPVAKAMFNDQLISKNKKSGAYRIVCMGGSSVRGDGLPPRDSFPSRLQAILKTQYPMNDIEVINLGGSGMTSAQLLWSAPAAITLQADLVVIYAGHNDWVGYRLNDNFVKHRALVKVRAYLSRSSFYSFMRISLLKTLGLRDEPAKQPPGGPAMPEELQKVAADFQNNIDKIIKLLRKNSVKVIAVSVISNPYFPPAGFPWPENYWENVNGIAKIGFTEDAISDLRKSAEKTNRTQDASVRSFLAGIRARQKDNLPAAYQLLAKARDLDNYPLRATSLFTKYPGVDDVDYLDLEARFEERFNKGERVGDLFLDNLHPSNWGGIWIANQIASKIRQKGIISSN